jgi:hypothetical protein
VVVVMVQEDLAGANHAGEVRADDGQAHAGTEEIDRAASGVT